MKIGERIRNRRIELGLTQQELAEKMGYTSRTTIARIENGSNELRQRQIVAMAEALNTTIDYIMGWEEADSIVLPEVASEAQNVADLYMKADEETRKMVDRLLAYSVNFKKD